MASLKTTSTTSSTSSLKGWGGLASGLDRDTLIEQMTYSTRSKIAKQQQKIDAYEWKQEAYQTVSDEMVDFANKYTDFTSSSNVASAGFYGRSVVSAQGDNAKYLNVSGTASSSNLFSVVGVKQMAQQASITSNGHASAGMLTTGSLAEAFSTGTTQVDKLGGSSLSIKMGGKSYTVSIPKGTDLSSADAIADALNEAMSKVATGSSKLSDHLKVGASDGKLTFENIDTAGNTVEILSGTGEAMQRMGLLGEGETKEEDQFKIANGQTLTAAGETSAYETMATSDVLAGKTMSFMYNGTTKSITLGSADEVGTLDGLKADLQSKLNEAFGTGRIQVDVTDSGQLSFQTTTPQNVDGKVTNGAADSTSTLSISGGESGLLGKTGLFGVSAGTSNRLNRDASILESGLKGAAGFDKAAAGDASLTINGKTIEGISWDSSIQEIMDAVNNDKDAGVTISYLQGADTFTMTAKEEGASGTVSISGNIADMLFGSDYKSVEGQDAIMAIQYAGSDEITEVSRGTNQITLDGLSVGVKGTFGYDESGNRIADTEAVTFQGKADVDKVTSAVKDMVEAFNSIIANVNKQVSTRPDNDYAPLTSEQRKEMSESEIATWEKKAKEGLLFGDTDLRNLSNALRFVLPTDQRADFAAIGITTSSSYSDNGKLVFDEEKFKAALESDPEKVKKLMTNRSAYSGGSDGLMTKISSVMDQYAKTTGASKGILIEKAGSKHSAVSQSNNYMKTQLDSMKKVLDTLNDRLENEETRYTNQFTSLETLISQMNSQSSYFSSM